MGYVSLKDKSASSKSVSLCRFTFCELVVCSSCICPVMVHILVLHQELRRNGLSATESGHPQKRVKGDYKVVKESCDSKSQLSFGLTLQITFFYTDNVSDNLKSSCFYLESVYG